jgi:hypothetical protein
MTKNLYNKKAGNAVMRKIIFVAGILLIALLSACRAPVAQERPEFVQQFRIGTQGLAMRFTPNLPPARLFSGEELGIILELENRGAYTLGGPGDRIYLSGFDPSIITGISPAGEQIPVLEGRSQYVNQGGFDAVSFKAPTRLLKDRYPVRLLATACYGYQTIATANACIDPNPYAPAIRQRVCTPTNMPMAGGQGGPVGVSLVETSASPGKTRFKIYVQNAGGGEVFRSGQASLARCSPFSQGLGFDEIDYVELADVIVSGISIRSTCRPLDQGHIRLTNGQGLTYCEFDLPRGEAPYVTPLTIVLRYGYRQGLFHDMEILPST